MKALIRKQTSVIFLKIYALCLLLWIFARKSGLEGPLDVDVNFFG